MVFEADHASAVHEAERQGALSPGLWFGFQHKVPALQYTAYNEYKTILSKKYNSRTT